MMQSFVWFNVYVQDFFILLNKNYIPRCNSCFYENTHKTQILKIAIKGQAVNFPLIKKKYMVLILFWGISV